MPHQSIDERISKEMKKLDKTKARLQTLKARSRTQEKKDETRTKILLGAWLLKSWESLDENAVQQQLKDIDTYLTRDNDKMLVPKIVKRLLNPKDKKSR